MPGDTNNAADVFLRDVVLGTTTRVSVATDGTQGNYASCGAGVSDHGGQVVFTSIANNLVPDDTNGGFDVFVRDVVDGTTTRVNAGPAGRQSNGHSWASGISGDGRWVVFGSDATSLVADDTGHDPDIYVHDLDAAVTTRVSSATDGSPGNGSSRGGSISGDGRYVAFESSASNLVSGDSNGGSDIFVRDLAAGKTERLNVGFGGEQLQGGAIGGDISADGASVVFLSHEAGLVGESGSYAADQAFLVDRATGAVVLVSQDASGAPFTDDVLWASVSPDGDHALFGTYFFDARAEEGAALSRTFLWTKRGVCVPAVAPYWQGWDIARDVLVVGDGSCGVDLSGYTVDGWGGTHAFGGANPLEGGPYWRGWDIARGMAGQEDGSAAVIVDGWGGLHRFGADAASINTAGGPYWRGWDIARGVATCAHGAAGVIVDGWGGLHRFGAGAASISTAGGPYWRGWDIARGVVITSDCKGGAVVDGWGGLHPFGSLAGKRISGGPYWPGWDIARGTSISPDGGAGAVVDGWGGLHRFSVS